MGNREDFFPYGYSGFIGIATSYHIATVMCGLQKPIQEPKNKADNGLLRKLPSLLPS